MSGLAGSGFSVTQRWAGVGGALTMYFTMKNIFQHPSSKEKDSDNTNQLWGCIPNEGISIVHRARQENAS